MSGRWVALLGLSASLAFAMVAGCNGNPLSGSSGAGDDDDDDIVIPPGSATYYEDILPVVMENCQSCHTEQGIAVPLDDYDVAALYAHAMALRTEAREMPPWPPDPACGPSLRNARLLDEYDKALIAQWAEDGAPEGNPLNAPTPTPTPAATPPADLILDWGADYTYDGSPEDLYMCFPVEPGVSADFVKAQIYPGNPRAVHHVILYRDRGGADGNLTPYTCGGPDGADFLVGWSPGAAPLTFDDGFGMQIDPDDKLIIQVHYHATGQEEVDRTRVGLWYGTVTQPARVVWAGALFGQVPSSLAMSGSCSLYPSAPDATLLGAAPHMHVRGDAFEVRLTRAGDSQDSCLMNLPKWDFEWQGGYFFEEPLTLNGGDRIDVTCRWKEGSQGTPFGEGTEDEMCFLFMYVAGGDLPQYCLDL